MQQPKPGSHRNQAVKNGGPKKNNTTKKAKKAGANTSPITKAVSRARRKATSNRVFSTSRSAGKLPVKSQGALAQLRHCAKMSHNGHALALCPTTTTRRNSPNATERANIVPGVAATHGDAVGLM
jgi:hypothetical protein